MAAYLLYTRLKADQRRKVFEKISTMLNSLNSCIREETIRSRPTTTRDGINYIWHTQHGPGGDEEKVPIPPGIQ